MRSSSLRWQLEPCVLFVFTVASAILEGTASASGTLKLSIVDSGSGQPTPARVEIVDAAGMSYTADNPLLIGGDCERRDNGPWNGTAEEYVARYFRPTINNPFTNTDHFYSTGASTASLPAGRYIVRVFKGTEFNLATQQATVQEGATTDVSLQLRRWIDLSAKGWYSGDEHLHIGRPFKDLDPQISQWMQAEDIHIASFLQWGGAFTRAFYGAPQYAHGTDGVYQKGDYILHAAQEAPRTHFRGHSVILGATKPVEFPETYLVYKHFWEEARRQGALSGYAHFANARVGGSDGIAIDLPDKLLNFVEVLQMTAGIYDTWYDTLNLGFRITPVAGTDYPCNGTIPGRERYFTRVEGALSVETWLEGVRRGRTFVSNGPFIELLIDGKGVGEEVLLEQAGEVRITGRVLFDPAQDDVTKLEVIENGKILPRAFERQGNEIVADFSHQVGKSSWFALRASGRRLNEKPIASWDSVLRMAGVPNTNPSLAHTAAIYVTLKNEAPLSQQAKARAVAATWLKRLQDFEARLAPEKLTSLDQTMADDGVTLDYLRKSRPELIQTIESAKAYFVNQMAGVLPSEPDAAMDTGPRNGAPAEGGGGESPLDAASAPTTEAGGTQQKIKSGCHCTSGHGGNCPTGLLLLVVAGLKRLGGRFGRS